MTELFNVFVSQANQLKSGKHRHGEHSPGLDGGTVPPGQAIPQAGHPEKN